MSDAPERIWAWEGPDDRLNWWYAGTGPKASQRVDVEYIRADLYRVQVERHEKNATEMAIAANAATMRSERLEARINGYKRQRDELRAKVEQLEKLLLQCDHPECAGLSMLANQEQSDE